MSENRAATGRLVLAPDEVPTGATVYLLDADTAEPLEADGKVADPLVCLISSVGMTRSFIPVHEGGKFGSRYDNVPPNARFTPVEAYKVGQAPPNRRFTVFLSGTRYLLGSLPVEVRTTGDGALLLVDDGAPIDLPEGAILVPLGDTELPPDQ